MRKLDLIIESLSKIHEGKKSEIDIESCKNIKLWIKDKKNAFTLFDYEGKTYIQGYEDGDKTLNATVGKRKELEKLLKENGFKEKPYSAEDFKSDESKAKKDNNIEEGKLDDVISSLSNKLTQTTSIDSDDAEQRAGVGVKLGMAGAKALGTAASGAITKLAVSKFGIIGASLLTNKSVLKVAILDKIPMTYFTNVALAGAGVAAAGIAITAYYAHRYNKAKNNENKGYKVSFGRYYKLKGREWVQIDKEQWYKETGKDKEE